MPIQFLSSSQCAPHSLGVKSPSQSGAQHRGLAPRWSRHDAADRVAKLASDGFALVETGELKKSLRQLSSAGGNHPRVVRHVSQIAHMQDRSDLHHDAPASETRLNSPANSDNRLIIALSYITVLAVSFSSKLPTSFASSAKRLTNQWCARD